MLKPLLNILLIEDNPGDAELVKATLGDTGAINFRVFDADALLPGLDRLAKGDIDVVLLDLSLPDSHGLEGVIAVRTHAPAVPVVVLTGYDNEALALRAVQSGAQEYLVKGTLEGPALSRVLQHAVLRQRNLDDKTQVEPRPGQSSVFGLMGAKGGVGNTTLACHMAIEFARQTEGRVLLMDLDSGGNAIGFLMNASVPYGILDASNDILRLDQERWKKLVSPGPGGLDVLQSAGPFFVSEMLPKPERMPFVLRFVRQLYDWILVDLGRLTPTSIRVADELDKLLLVSSCDVLGLNETKLAVNALAQAGCASGRISVVLNQAPSRFGFSVPELEKILGASIGAILPECGQDLADSCLSGKRLGESRKFQKQTAQVVATLSGGAQNAATNRRFFFFAGAR